MGRTLIEQLADDLVGWLNRGQDGVPRAVLLWLDLTEEFSRLATAVEAELASRNVRFLQGERNAQLPLKLDLLRLDRDGGRAVVYLPGCSRADLEPHADGKAPGLWGIYEYRYRGAVWGILPENKHWVPGGLPEAPSLCGWLRAQSIGMDTKIIRPLSEDGANSLIARYAEKRAHDLLNAWPRPLRKGDVQALLGGEPRDELKALILAPDRAVAKWGTNAAQVRESLEDMFGLTFSESATPSAMADETVVQLALCEAWKAFGEAKDFPFLARLPADEGHRRQLAKCLVVDILPNDEARAAYRSRIAPLETQYDLSGWARAHTGEPAGLPGFSKARWRRFLDEFDAVAEKGWKEARDFVQERSAEIDAAKRDRWATAQDDCHWGVLADLVALAGAARDAVQHCESIPAVGDLVKAYAEQWWRTDALHLAVRAVCSENHHLEHVRSVADRAYFEYVAAVNEVFSKLIEDSGAWAGTGVTSIADVRHAVWIEDGPRRGVIVSDALRWDLGARIADGLADGKVTPVLSTLPSITPYGMTAMLPLREGEPVVKWAGGPTIKDNGGKSLADRAKRKELIAEVLAQHGRTVEFLEMAGLLRSKKVPTADVVVVFDTNIDSIGHDTVDTLPSAAKKLVADIRRSIEKLHSFGVERVHVLTDHGFLLLPPEAVEALGQPPLAESQCTKRQMRWAAVKPDAHVDGLIRIAMPMAPDQGTLAFPRGVRTFVKSEPYMHGGISLQECVLPHVVSVGSLPKARVRPQLSVSQPKLTTGTVSYTMTPAPLTQMPLGGLEPAFVRVFVVTNESPPQRISGEREEELRQDVPELKAALFLDSGKQLRAGTSLILRCEDRDTREELDTVRLTLAIDWD